MVGANNSSRFASFEQFIGKYGKLFFQSQLFFPIIYFLDESRLINWYLQLTPQNPNFSSIFIDSGTLSLSYIISINFL